MWHFQEDIRNKTASVTHKSLIFCPFAPLLTENERGGIFWLRLISLAKCMLASMIFPQPETCILWQQPTTNHIAAMLWLGLGKATPPVDYASLSFFPQQ